MATVGSIDAQLRLQYDQFINGLRAAASAAGDFGRGAGAAFGSLSDVASQSFARVNQGLATMRKACNDASEGFAALGRAMTAYSATVGAGMTFAGKSFLEYESNMRNVNSISKDSEATFRKFYDTLLDMPRTEQLTQGPRALSAALYDINSSGFSGAQGIEVLKAAANAADAGLTDVKVSAAGLSGILNAYGLSASDATTVSDKMFKTVELGVISYEQLAGSIGTVNATAASAGVSLNEMMAGIVVLTRKGIQPGQAMTALNSAILHMVSPSKTARDTMDSLGIQINETTLKTKGLGWAIQELYSKTGGSTDKMKKILEDSEALKAVLSIGSDTKGFKTFTSQIDNSQGATAASKAEQAKAILTQLKRAWAEMEAIAIKAGNFMAPYIATAVDWLQKLQKAWEGLSPGVQKAAVLLTAVSGVVAGVGSAFVLLAPQIAAVLGLLSGGTLTAIVGGAVTALSGLILPVTLAAAGIAALYYAWRENWGGIQETTYSVAGAVWRYLVDGFQYLKVEVPKLWNATYDALRFAINRFWVEIKPAVQEGVSFLGEAWDSIVPIVKMWWAVYLPALKAEFLLLWEVVKFSMASISAYWGIAWEVIKGVISTVWPLVKGVVLAGLDVVKGLFTAFGKAVNGDWQGAWDSMVLALEKAGSRIVTAVKNAMANALQAVKNVIGEWELAGENLMRAFARGLVSGGGIIQKAAQAMATGSKEAGPDMEDRPLQPSSVAPLLPKTPYNVYSVAAAVGTPKEELQPPPPAPIPKKVHVKAPPKKMLQVLLEIEQGGDKGARLLGAGGGFYDWRGPSQYRTQAGQHNGYDIAMAKGSRVGAAWKGVVREIYEMGPPGEYGVVVDSGAFSTKYNHIDPGVRVGSTVSPGDVIGRTVIDHLDVKMVDEKGQYFDPRVTVDKSGSRGTAMAEQSGNAYNNYMNESPEGLRKEWDAKREEEEKKFAAAKMHVQKGSKEDEELLALHQRKLERIALMENRALEDQQVQRDKMAAGTEAAEIAGTGRVELAKLAITERYRQQYRALEDQEAQHPDKAVEIEKTRGQLRIAEAHEQSQVLIGIVEELNTARYKATVEEQKVNDQMFAERTRQIEEERKMGRITSEEAMARYGQELNTYQSGSQARLDAEFTYQEKFKEQLQLKQQILGDDFLAYLEKLKLQLLTVDQTLVTNQLQFQAVQQALQAQRLAKLQEERQKIQQVATSINQSFTSFLEQVATGQQSFNTAFQSLWKSIVQIVIQYITQMIVKTLALQAVMKGVFGFLTGGAGLFTGGIGTSFTEFLPIAHAGGLVVPGGIQSFHTGGMVGLRQDEVLAKLQVGEMVLSRDQVAAARDGARGSRGEQPVLFSPQITFSGDVHVHSEADIDRLSETITQRMRDEWQGWR